MAGREPPGIVTAVRLVYASMFKLTCDSSAERQQVHSVPLDMIGKAALTVADMLAMHGPTFERHPCTQLVERRRILELYVSNGLQSRVFS
jgi:hypothetical protein